MPEDKSSSWVYSRNISMFVIGLQWPLLWSQVWTHRATLYWCRVKTHTHIFNSRERTSSYYKPLVQPKKVFSNQKQPDNSVFVSILSPFFKKKGEKAIDTSIFLWCRPSGSSIGPTFFLESFALRKPRGLSHVLSPYLSFQHCPFLLQEKRTRKAQSTASPGNIPSKTTALN